MKQYLNINQTAKLIELEFEKPTMKNISTLEGEINEEWYSIGELIEMLPTSLTNPYNSPLGIDYNGMWRVYYGVQEDYSWEWSIWYEEERNELIDALYDMAVKLKEEGVI